MITHVLPSARGDTSRTSVKRLMGPNPGSSHGLLQLLEVELAELRHLGRDHQAAVPLVRIVAEVAAAGLLGGVELGKRGQARYRGGGPGPSRPRPPCYLLRPGALCGGPVVESRR